VVTGNVGCTKMYLWLTILLRTFIGMVGQEFLVNTVIILQLSNPSPALEVRFLKSIAFEKIEGALEM
jgi:hypothetical protein